MEIKIVDDLITTIKSEMLVKDVRQGPFQTAVLTDKCGLASTPYSYTYRHGDLPVKEAGNLIGKRALEAVKMVYSSSQFVAAIGMAMINSLIEIPEESCVHLNAGDLLAEQGKNRKVALVGHFPFVPKLRRIVKELWVIEQNLQEGDLTEDKAGIFLPQAEVIGITGSAFTNHTIDYLIGLCRPEAYVIVLGPTTPLSPILFNYGVNAVSGTMVVNPEAVLRCVSQGATFRQIEGIQMLTIKRD
ncbi:MAG: DUF364 domain-containing protein [Dehalococcoidales bacterium]|nr:DUF364 domain-containing protein [Dehalococcoidales bacterium]